MPAVALVLSASRDTAVTRKPFCKASVSSGCQDHIPCKLFFFWQFIPVVTGFLGVIFWLSYGMLQGVPFSKRTENMRTPKDKFIVTVTAIIFLMYPTMCEKAFAMFSLPLVIGMVEGI